MKEFESDPNNSYQTAEEELHGIGAHEEVHLIDPSNIKDSQNLKGYERGYQTEKSAFEAETIASEKRL